MRVCSALRFATPILVLALTIACSDTGSPNSDGSLPTLTDAGFYPLLSTHPSSDAGNEVTLSLKQVPGGVELASVQGEIEFDATVLQLVRTVLPDGIDGDAAEVSPGRVRFVGTLVQGATEPPLLRLEFRGRETVGVLTREMFSVRFEEVTGGSDLADLTASVRSDRLLFVQSR